MENKTDFEISYLKRINMFNYKNKNIYSIDDQKQIMKIMILILLLISILIISNFIL